MSIGKSHLYINSRGQFVTRHSYSGSEAYHFCARKYYLERVQGWAEKVQRAATFFGTALETAITFWHRHKEDTPAAVAEFVRLWAEHKDKPYTYSKGDLDWNRLNLTGQEMVKLYALKYPTFPYVVKNPAHDFQVETTFEMFPGTSLAGLEFTSYIDLLATLKDTNEPLIADIKTYGNDVPDLITLDPQLRSYAWVRKKPGNAPTPVAWVWFRKMGRTVSKGDPITMLEPYAGLQCGDEAWVLATDDFGAWLTQDKTILEEIDTKFVGKSKAVLADRAVYIEGHAKNVPERAFTKQRLYFKMGLITAESAEDIGRSIKRDMVNIAAANEKDFWPMESGVRFPNEKCPNCAMRGICSNDPNLRDSILVRKQIDELDFSKESE